MHSFILKKKEEPPVCVASSTMITIKHELIECGDLVEVRKKYFEEKALHLLSRNLKSENLFWLSERDRCLLYTMRCLVVNFV